VFGCVFRYVWVTESEEGVVKDMCKVLEAGGVQGWDRLYTNDAQALIARPAVEAGLLDVLRPKAVEKYAVVVGASGTGKSTAVRRVVRRLAEKPFAGLAYFSAPELVTDFSRDLAQILGYREPIEFGSTLRRLFVTRETKETSSAPPLRDEPRASWSRLSPLLKASALSFKAKHGKAPTLVLDAMDLVAKEDPAFFLQVQNFAKACADSGILRVVFVFSDGSALPLLLSSSAETRCDTDQICEISDISDPEAIKYVVDRFELPAKVAAELVTTITGGRFPLLQAYGKSTRPLGEIRAQLDSRVLVDLKLLEVPLTHALLRALLAAQPKGGLKAEAVLELMPPGKVEGLLRRNILAAHPNGTYSLNNRRVVALVKGAAEAEGASSPDTAV
jgi:hypothetical protein